MERSRAEEPRGNKTRHENYIIVKLQHLNGSTGWSQRAKVQPSADTEKTHFRVPHTLEGGLVYNGGHVCETLLLSAAIRAAAQCQISGGITNGVNYNIFWCMGKFRHWPGVMTIPQEVLRKSVRAMCWRYICESLPSTIKRIRNSQGHNGLPPLSRQSTI